MHITLTNTYTNAASPLKPFKPNTKKKEAMKSRGGRGATSVFSDGPEFLAVALVPSLLPCLWTAVFKQLCYSNIWMNLCNSGKYALRLHVPVCKHVDEFAYRCVHVLNVGVCAQMFAYASIFSEADLAYVADSILFGVDLGTDPSPAAPGLDDRVWRWGRNLIVMWIWLAVRFLTCHDLLAFFLQKHEDKTRLVEGQACREWQWWTEKMFSALKKY